VIRDYSRREKAGDLKPAMAVRRAHHGNLDALIAQSDDTSGPFSFDRGLPFQFEAELAKEINRPSKVIDDDSYVVQPFERHASNLQGVVESNNVPFLQRRSTTRRGACEIAPNSAYSGGSRALVHWTDADQTARFAVQWKSGRRYWN
jgi:hypothetical protein